MTPTPKHIEEAQRFADHICLDTERDVVVQKLATLLAAQEELETTKKRCELLLIQQGHDEEARDEMAKHNALLHNVNDQLRAERDDLQHKLTTANAVIKDDCENEEMFKKLASKALTGFQVEGDSNGVPTFVDMGELLVDEVLKLRIHNAALLAVARAAIAYHKDQGTRGYQPRTVAEENFVDTLNALEPLGIKV